LLYIYIIIIFIIKIYIQKKKKKKKILNLLLFQEEFHGIFEKFEMNKNLLLIDECCKQGKKISPNDTPNKPVNIIYNR